MAKTVLWTSKKWVRVGVYRFQSELLLMLVGVDITGYFYRTIVL